MTFIVDGTVRSRIEALGQKVLQGGQINRAEALFLFNLENTADFYDLLAWANRLRQQFHNNRIHLCSIINAKAGSCPENCKFCAQSAFYQTGTPRHGFLDREPLVAAAEEAHRHGVSALALVAAWKGLSEGSLLDEVCARLTELAQTGKVSVHASLGLIKEQKVADRLRSAGCICYNHNLESSRRFFPEHCTSHTFDDRLRTIQLLKKAGIQICSGGILGMGETVEDRCDLAMALREIDARFVPLNILTPIPGTPFAHRPPLAPLEVLKTIACFRFVLPRQEILVAGGRAAHLRDLQSLVFAAGASALMVGDYLTTVNQPVEKDLQMLRDLGLKSAAE